MNRLVINLEHPHGKDEHEPALRIGFDPKRLSYSVPGGHRSLGDPQAEDEGKGGVGIAGIDGRQVALDDDGARIHPGAALLGELGVLARIELERCQAVAVDDPGVVAAESDAGGTALEVLGDADCRALVLSHRGRHS